MPTHTALAEEGEWELVGGNERRRGIRVVNHAHSIVVQVVVAVLRGHGGML